MNGAKLTVRISIRHFRPQLRQDYVAAVVGKVPDCDAFIGAVTANVIPNVFDTSDEAMEKLKRLPLMSSEAPTFDRMKLMDLVAL